MAETISFTPIGGGWDTFHSFIPEWMISTGNNMYSFNNGDIYKHSSNSTRNEYYGTTYDSTITTVFNQGVTEVVMFKTLALEGDSTWDADITTDLSTGEIDSAFYKEKEGDQYAYIRRPADTIDTKAISTQGIGLASAYAALVITFPFTISASIAENDKVYISDGTNLTLIGAVDSHTSTTITVDAAAVVPSPGDFIVVVKSSLAESFGARGYYMEVKLTNSEVGEVELFSVSSEVFESKP
jgi:hypothetical protein